jgi:signal transduction histidine kinase
MTRILVVEDADVLRQDIVEMLHLEGFEVDEAENGAIAIQRLMANRPDMIISDIMMPVMDGIDLLKAVRSIAEMTPIPFIFLTARADRMDMRVAMELGADDFVTKPFHAAEVLAAVHTQFRKQHERHALLESRMETLRGNIIVALPHELRTPLNSILGFSELLMSDGRNISGARTVEMARHIHNAGQRLYALIDNYLLYAQLELIATDARRTAELQRELALSAGSVVQNSALQVAQHYQRQDRLQLSIEEGVALAINELYLKKIVDELVDNAFKFSPHDSEVRVCLTTDGTHGKLKVSDQGVGLSAEQIEQIGAYMQFARRLREQQGTGLGLAIVSRLCDLHNGSMTIESEPDAWTLITVTLPLHPV